MAADMYEKDIRNFIEHCPKEANAAQAIALAMIADAIRNGIDLLCYGAGNERGPLIQLTFALEAISESINGLGVLSDAASE